MPAAAHVLEFERRRHLSLVRPLLQPSPKRAARPPRLVPAGAAQPCTNAASFPLFHPAAFWLSWMAVEVLAAVLFTLLLIAFGAMFQFDFFLKNSFALVRMRSAAGRSARGAAVPGRKKVIRDVRTELTPSDPYRCMPPVCACRSSAPSSCFSWPWSAWHSSCPVSRRCRRCCAGCCWHPCTAAGTSHHRFCGACL